MNIIQVTDQPIAIDSLFDWLSETPQDGAVVTFIGKVRSLDNQITSLYLEHYSGMTEKVLAKIVNQARSKWQINRVAVIHRVGEINAGEKIVFVGVSSAHRTDSFAATEFIMDLLKNEAPFWKKERTDQGEYWVKAKKSDAEALKKWY
ncbi:molybdopterin synthase catalytic subunit MoaE [Gilliamella sp. wkB112]|uniref:molybdopterin synthase catalytic subunit MoaE n=1 Tax=Gilliamella sp. wkB112 TaxID=3120257 RepID=UPI00080EC924|nr:molybdopterin synthase catalytic subunit MoaE [Gilliamella apicola]OCG04715.1 molybdenum cofactor biosynthesis protein MoaE [Gilliamella apicola]